MDVSLLVISDLGCTAILTNNCMIDVFALPIRHFSYSPGNPTNLAPEVVFTDQTIGAEEWFWNIANQSYKTEPNFVTDLKKRASLKLASSPQTAMDVVIRLK